MDYSKISDKYESVAEVELSEPCWSFDLLGIWKAEDGYYLSTDSGCSCPTPWESHTDDDLTGPLTASQAQEEATSLWADEDGDGYDPEAFAAAMALIV
mgnify:CR=1 FL=1